MYRIIFTISLLILLLISPRFVMAANEFSSSYNVVYSVSDDAVTSVEEKITLKNLTDKFFPSSFSLVLPGNEVFETQAFDSQGALEVDTTSENANTKLTVKFTNQQIIGLGKEYNFTLKFKDKGITKNLGAVKSVNIPKVTQETAVEGFNLILSVPTSFGDPDYISPKPSKVSESGGLINLNFDSNILSQTGISAIFGRSLSFAIGANYHLRNDTIFPKFINIPIFFASGYQKIFIENIEPRPENTFIDKAGNTLATFKLNPRQALEVKVNGFAQTNLTSLSKEVLSKEEKQKFLDESKFWDKNNPVIKTKLGEILENNEDGPDLEKGYEINRFVSNFLQFDYPRFERNDFLRFGSVTALNNPEKSLTAEFVDLELALMRSAGIPARQVVGFSIDQPGKPQAFGSRGLHSWVEIYDDGLGWVIADPTWQNTTKGANFYNFNDLSHIGLAWVNGDTDFVFPSSVEAKITESRIEEKRAAEFDIDINPEILSGFPSKAKIRINNLGNSTFPSSELKIDTSKILLEGLGHEPSITVSTKTPEIPPFGNLQYDLNLKTGAIWHSYQDIFQATFAEVTDSRVITVQPILSYKIFAVEIFGGLIIISLFYILVFLVHRKSTKKH